MALAIEIVTPRGIAMKRTGLTKVILRRREERFEMGSEVAVLPHHGEMMVKVPECEIKLVAAEQTIRVHVSGGFAEVRDDHIVLLTTNAEVVPGEAPGCPQA